MAKIQIPEKYITKIGAPMQMDVHWVDVKLKDGRKFRKLVVRGGQYITGRYQDKTGESDLDFSTDDILKIRRSSFLPFW
jgi:hypothetical protein